MIFTSRQKFEYLFLRGGRPKHRIVEKKTSPYETTMQLTVRNWQKDDESHFSCIATNSLGKADRRIQSYSKSVTAYGLSKLIC